MRCLVAPVEIRCRNCGHHTRFGNDFVSTYHNISPKQLIKRLRCKVCGTYQHHVFCHDLHKDSFELLDPEWDGQPEEQDVPF